MGRITDMTDTATAKRDRDSRVNAAWDDLALNKALQTVFLDDLQALFSPFSPSFQGPDYNPYAAAQRDGAKQVIAHIHKRLGAAKLRITDNNKPATNPTAAKV